MASYGPGIGNYGRRPNLGAGIGRGLSSLADRLREIEGQKIRANEIAGERAYETERSDLEFSRNEQSRLAQSLREEANALARDTRRENFEIAGEGRQDARLLERENREVNSLTAGLRSLGGNSLNAVSNADQEVPAGTFERESIIASRNPRLMEGLLTGMALDPMRREADIGAYRQKAAIDREFAPPRAPTPYNAPDRITDGQGRILEVLPNGQTRVLAGPNGQPLTAPRPASATDPNKLATLNQRFATRIKPFEQAAEGYGRILAANPANPTAADDMAMIFGFMKLMDPTSVVRETEYANAENARGVAEDVRNVWNRLKDGRRLTPEQRQRYVTTAGQLADQYRTRLGPILQQQRQIAGDAADVTVYDPFEGLGPSRNETPEQRVQRLMQRRP